MNVATGYDAAEPMFNAWRAAGKPAELPIFEAGSHGFGMVKQDTSADHWIDEFYRWRQARGELPASKVVANQNATRLYCRAPSMIQDFGRLA